MGLLDQMIGSILGNGTRSQTGMGGLGDLLSGLGGGGQTSGGGNMLATLLPLVLALLQNRGAGASGGSGLEGLLGQLRASGLERQADSWVGAGTNLPVSAEELMNALGRGRVSELAAQTGMPEQQVGEGLASLLPELVNQLTPQGRLPADNDVDDAMGSLRRSLGL